MVGYYLRFRIWAEDLVNEVFLVLGLDYKIYILVGFLYEFFRKNNFIGMS